MAIRNEKSIDKQIRESVINGVGKALSKGFDIKYVTKLKDRIVTRTRLGIGVDPKTGNGYRLPKLSKEYITARKGTNISKRNAIDKGRRKAAKKTGTDPQLVSTTTPSKSNLTATGQLLDSLSVTKIRVRGGLAYLISIGDRRGRDLFGRTSKIGNKLIAKYQEEASKSRTFMGFTKSQRNIVKKEVRQFIIKFLR